MQSVEEEKPVSLFSNLPVSGVFKKDESPLFSFNSKPKESSLFAAPTENKSSSLFGGSLFGGAASKPGEGLFGAKSGGLFAA